MTLISSLVISEDLFNQFGNSANLAYQDCDIGFYLDPASGQAQPGDFTTFDVVLQSMGECGWQYYIQSGSNNLIQVVPSPASGEIAGNSFVRNRVDVYVDPGTPAGPYTVYVDVTAYQGEAYQVGPQRLEFFLDVGSAPTEEPGQPSLFVDRNSIDFGIVQLGSQSTDSFTVGNLGSGELFVSAITASGAGFDLCGASQIGSFTLSSGELSTFSVCFQPESAGFSQGQVTISSNDPEMPTFSIPLSGEVLSNEAPPETSLIGGLTTDLGCLEDGDRPVYLSGSRIVVYFGMSGAASANAQVMMQFENGIVQSIFQGPIFDSDTNSVEVQAGPGTGIQTFVFAARVGEARLQLICSVSVVSEGEQPPPSTPIDEQSGVILGTVYEDLDQDGLKDANENVLRGVDVSLRNGPSTSTGLDGTYEFTVAGGSYTVVVAAPTGWLVTTQNPVDVAVVPGEVVIVDFGLLPPLAERPPQGPSITTTALLVGTGLAVAIGILLFWDELLELIGLKPPPPPPIVTEPGTPEPSDDPDSPETGTEPDLPGEVIVNIVTVTDDTGTQWQARSTVKLEDRFSRTDSPAIRQDNITSRISLSGLLVGTRPMLLFSFSIGALSDRLSSHDADFNWNSVFPSLSKLSRSASNYDLKASYSIAAIAAREKMFAIQLLDIISSRKELEEQL